MSQLEVNKGDNVIIILDVSASMQTTDTPSGASRIDFVKENAKTIAVEAGKWDTDGVDGFTFGHKVTSIGKLTADNVNAVIDPLKANEGSTDTAAAIAEAWKQHRAGGYKQTVAMLFTDGEPNDEDKVFSTIAGITQELKDEHEFALSILTVGQRSAGLEAFLTKLDDALPGAKHDIVDVKRVEEVDFYAAFAGALHD
ncbi:MAG TPA: VWA domain-containing protein [Polyangiaceae bacterium]